MSFWLKHLKESRKKKKGRKLLGSLAACLMLAIVSAAVLHGGLFGSESQGDLPLAFRISAAEYPEYFPKPNYEDYDEYKQVQSDYFAAIRERQSMFEGMTEGASLAKA